MALARCQSCRLVQYRACAAGRAGDPGPADAGGTYVLQVEGVTAEVDAPPPAAPAAEPQLSSAVPSRRRTMKRYGDERQRRGQGNLGKCLRCTFRRHTFLTTWRRQATARIISANRVTVVGHPLRIPGPLPFKFKF